eukprot:7450069-Heterocapsa_arctica.AAC.1
MGTHNQWHGPRLTGNEGPEEGYHRNTNNPELWLQVDLSTTVWHQEGCHSGEAANWLGTRPQWEE